MFRKLEPTFVLDLAQLHGFVPVGRFVIAGSDVVVKLFFRRHGLDLLCLMCRHIVTRQALNALVLVYSLRLAEGVV